MIERLLRNRWMRVAVMALFLVVGCAGNADSQADRDAAGDAGNGSGASSAQFGAYWYQGKGELNRYALEQARYGEIRHGDAMMVFVTEDFLGDRQVKLESDPTGKDVVKILKLNFVKKFQTGVYPYSMMTSVFTAVDPERWPLALKVTTTVQEWCGHVFTQLNLRGGRYDVHSYSYFETEGDEEFQLDGVIPEDEIWTRIRLNPASLPIGSVRFIPGTMTTRLRHTPLATLPANATSQAAGVDSVYGPIMSYTIKYTDADRTLVVDYQRDFPHLIVGWSETYHDGFGPNPPLLTTHARLTTTTMLDYWRHNSNADDSLRQTLGLP